MALDQKSQARELELKIGSIAVKMFEPELALQTEEIVLRYLDQVVGGSELAPLSDETLVDWLQRQPWSCPIRNVVERQLSPILPTLRGMTSARRAEKEAAAVLERKIASFKVSDSRHDYVISNDDYKRGLDKEREYLLRHKASLLRLFDNRCANCGDDENGIDIDHFVFSKNEGGCFSMQHRDGFLFNNAIPLCESCNRSKSDKNYRAFFSPDRLVEIFEKNSLMTIRLNSKKAS